MRRQEAVASQVTSVVVMWECELKAKLHGDREFKERLDSYTVRNFVMERWRGRILVQVFGRLRIRDALQGGRVEVFRKKARAEKGWKIHYYDVTS